MSDDEETVEFPDCLCRKCGAILHPKIYTCKMVTFGDCDDCRDRCKNYEECRPWEN